MDTTATSPRDDAPASEIPGPIDRRLLSFAALLLLVVSAVFVADHDAWTPDEPRVMELARSVGTGPRAVPLLGGEPFLEQPSLYYATVALGYRLLGTHVAVARGVSSLFGALTLLLTYLYASRLRGPRVGALAAIALGLSFQFFWISHRIVVDSALGFFVACSAYASLRGLTAGTERARTAGVLLAYAAASLAYLTKGVIGIGLSGFAFLSVVAALGDWGLLLRARLWAAPLVFLALTTPYHLAAYREVGREGLYTLLVFNTLNRAAGLAGTPGHAAPWHYYLGLFPADFLPSTLFLAAALVRFARERRALSKEARLAVTAPLLWLAAGIAGLSLAESKRELYIVPLLPAAATLAAIGIEDLITGRASSRLERAIPLLFAGLLALLGAGLPVAAVYLRLPLAAPLWGTALTVALAAQGARLWLEGRRGDGLAALATGLVACMVLGCAAFVPWLDDMKGMGRFIREAGRRIPEGRALYVLAPDETALGAVPFYTGRDVLPIATPEALSRRLSSEGEVWAFAIDKNDASPIFYTFEPLHPEVVAAEAEVRLGARLLRLLRFRTASEEGHP